MKKKNLLGAAAAALFVVGTAHAEEAAKPGAASYNWTGFYGGVAAGAALGQYDSQISTVGGGYMNATQAAAVTAAGAQTIKPLGFTAGIEGGYNWQIGPLLLGVEADFQALHLNDSTGSGAVPYPNTRRSDFTATSFGNADWLFTARPRVGLVAPNHWLFYGTGGVAITQLQSDFSFVDNRGALESGSLNTAKVGYAVGGGVEAPLTGRITVKVDYLHVAFANTAGSASANSLSTSFPAQQFSYSGDMKADIIRAGLNYRLGGPDATSLNDPVLWFKTPGSRPQPAFFAGWQLETGARLWLGTGSVGAPQPLLNDPPTTLASRLIYSGLDAVSGETFARANHSSGFFVKGYLGAGGITGGRLNDEDFPASVVYSNTLSTTNGHIGYATIDVGYDIWQTPGAKVGPFVGYNYYTQAISAWGCTQLAGDLTCSPALQPGLLTLTENDSFNSLRIGLSSEVKLADRVRLTVDAAYVPVVAFGGLDNHLLRQLLLPGAASSGDGVMLEAVLDYSVTDMWSVGVGARYWAWNTDTGTETFNFLGAPPPSFVEPGRFTTERLGMFVQSSYRWGDPPLPSVSASGAPIAVKARPVASAQPMNWTGFYVGGHLGGGWSDGDWADPFGPTTVRGGRFTTFTNVAGFGDSTHATGPLGGGQIGVNWQTGHLVLGAEVSGSAANLSGENTCFSGIGGVDCQHTVTTLSTVTGRAGIAWDRSLAYVKGGGAWAATNYSLLANTGALSLGTGSTTIDTWGWTVGGGIEYAMTNHWTVFAEYDHVELPAAVVPFPTVALISAQTISVRQSMELFKMGLNYRFDLAALAAGAAGATKH